MINFGSNKHKRLISTIVIVIVAAMMITSILAAFIVS